MVLGIITDILVELFSKNKDKLLMLQLDNNLGILESYQINEITKSIEEQNIIKYLKNLNNRLDIAYRVKEKEVLKTKIDLITKEKLYSGGSRLKVILLKEVLKYYNDANNVVPANVSDEDEFGI